MLTTFNNFFFTLLWLLSSFLIFPFFYMFFYLLDLSLSSSHRRTFVHVKKSWRRENGREWISRQMNRNAYEWKYPLVWALLSFFNQFKSVCHSPTENIIFLLGIIILHREMLIRSVLSLMLILMRIVIEYSIDIFL